ncbi:hypothetical protein BN948_03078 [Hydrogenophaga intermedia]|uniref:Uncharacterized protein n=1 Tax=Hydrogenophaga intermedia TaxID=65786 RepID=A0A1L1PLE9_HYDIT|nr:hypothetical protein BN948_03078 [Hydrogenophaga intermedia]
MFEQATDIGPAQRRQRLARLRNEGIDAGVARRQRLVQPQT